MEWKDEYLIGVEHIDEQHKSLFAKANELAEIVNRTPENKQAITEAMLFLKRYALRHFADEEKYQKSIGYADLVNHQALHRALVADLLRQEEILAQSDYSANDVKSLIAYLSAWMLDHVVNSDLLIRDYKPSSRETVKPGF